MCSRRVLQSQSKQANVLLKIANFQCFEIVLKSLFDVANYLHKAKTNLMRPVTPPQAARPVLRAEAAVTNCKLGRRAGRLYVSEKTRCIFGTRRTKILRAQTFWR